ncbi:hypothetical protein NIES4103_05950 [Nostoc sp. NIES-4103]|nr:hypothetical protein NIES4103_05950 [Nostoc sp. NIES-4103]
MNKPYNQHYVPQSILRNFEFQNDKVYSLIKVNEEELVISPINVKKLCQERGFYEKSATSSNNTQIGKINYDISAFDKLDSEIAPIFIKIIQNDDLQNLDSNESSKLIEYTVYQYLRVKSVRNIGHQFWDNEEDIRDGHAEILTDKQFITDVINILSNYQLDIIKPISGDEFVISDSPVLWDATGEGIYFPINPNICLYYHHKKYGLDNRLDSICINELQFSASVKHTIARSESVLHKLKNNEHKDHIVNFCQSGRPSYWKCILQTRNFEECKIRFKDLMGDFEII